MHLLVYNRSEHVRMDSGSVAPMAAWTIHAMFSGSVKFDTTPGGGGEAGIISSPIAIAGDDGRSSASAAS